MELSNAISDLKVEPNQASEAEIFAVTEAIESLVIMLTPFAPHTAEELFAEFAGNSDGILANGARFPDFDPELIKSDEIEIPVQVNGKLRSRVMASADATSDQLQELALNDEKIREYTDGKGIVKVVVVPKRLVSIVIRG